MRLHGSKFRCEAEFRTNKVSEKSHRKVITTWIRTQYSDLTRSNTNRTAERWIVPFRADKIKVMQVDASIDEPAADSVRPVLTTLRKVRSK